jgi:hypothetical protein
VALLSEGPSPLSLWHLGRGLGEAKITAGPGKVAPEVRAERYAGHRSENTPRRFRIIVEQHTHLAKGCSSRQRDQLQNIWRYRVMT